MRRRSVRSSRIQLIRYLLDHLCRFPVLRIPASLICIATQLMAKAIAVQLLPHFKVSNEHGNHSSDPIDAPGQLFESRFTHGFPLC